MSVLDTIVFVLSAVIFVYFVAYSLATFALIAGSLAEAAYVRFERGEHFTPPRRVRRPGISLIAPVYNLEPLVVGCVHSLLAAEYAPLEVIVVDDGSKDGTFAALDEAFDLVALPVGDRFAIATAPITEMLVSRRDPRLRVVRKENGGRSDALNAGLNVARLELVAMIDGDTLVERDALARVGEVFALDPDNIVAVGGTIRIANGAEIERNAVVEVRASPTGVEASQTAEYLRGFLGSRIAWSRLNALLIISGAFGVFRRELARSGGGLSKETLGEDMELTMRLHHQLYPSQPQTKIAYAPDATAWTEIPNALAPLRTQRIRWHVGLLDNLRIHREMLFRPRYGRVGMLALPYSLLFETVGPVLQVCGLAILGLLVWFQVTSWWYVAAALLVTMLVGQLQTAGALLIEEVGFGRYRLRDLTVIALWSLVELFWYRPLTAVWRTWATVLVLLGRRPGWGSIPRGVAFKPDPEAEIVAAPLPR